MVQFGTSGLRGLAVELNEEVIGAHVAGFIEGCGIAGKGLYVGQDLRQSAPRIAKTVINTATTLGIDVTDCGVLPTPALALAAGRAGAAAIMVTGSHIPADRNGLKFYTPAGEITKAEEQAILAAMTPPVGPGDGIIFKLDANAAYLERARIGFGRALEGMRIALWSHAAAGRDVLAAALTQAGAEVVEVGRSETFVAVDTEAVDVATRRQMATWAAGCDALVSTDGDGDRPLVADETGRVVPGDILGQITARALGATCVVTPVSSNTGIELGGGFERIIRTQIGSPYVITQMEEAPGKVIGYEANGGVLLGFEAQGPAGPLPPLMTRDSLLPILTVLSEARRVGGLAQRAQEEPPRVTVTDRLQDIPRDVMNAIIAELCADPQRYLPEFAGPGAQLASEDQTDGLRLTLADGRILHLRPSGNAPELRFYVEAASEEAGQLLSDRIRAALMARL